MTANLTQENLDICGKTDIALAALGVVAPVRRRGGSMGAMR